MEMTMSASDVIAEIRRLQQGGDPLNKKKMKQTNPQLLKNALYYFPSWEHAITNSQEAK
jgi:hypothetical protein